MNREIAGKIWDVLVAECGASERCREDFVAYVHRNGLTEYRFQGGLGFGGKVYGEPLRVSCYSEDENQVRLAAIKAANERLESLLPKLPRLR